MMMSKVKTIHKLLIVWTILGHSFCSFAQTPDFLSLINVHAIDSTTLTHTKLDSGMFMFDTRDNALHYYDGVIWVKLTADIDTSNEIIDSISFINDTLRIYEGGKTFASTLPPLPASATSIVGDVKYGMQTADHNGWYLLDGRAISTLDTLQRAAAISLGFSTNLPSTESSYLASTTDSLGTVSGSNLVTITKDNLPNYTITGRSSSTKNFTFDYKDRSETSNTANTNNNLWRGRTNQSKTLNYPNYTFTSDFIGDGNNLNIKPRTMSVNIFVYLGK